jgi:hypothetical protein
MNPSKLNNDTPSWFEGVLNQFIEIDQVLQEIDSSIIMIWWPLSTSQIGPDSLSIHYLTQFKTEQITFRTDHLIKGPLFELLIACDTFFFQRF